VVLVPGTERMGSGTVSIRNFDFVSNSELVVSRPTDPGYLSSWELVIYDLDSGQTSALGGPGNLLLPRASADGRSIAAMQLALLPPDQNRIIVFPR
jgi:hypothetical protein